VNESAQQRQRMLDLFSAGRDPEWRNRLIWGDKYVPSCCRIRGQTDLIYIDPCSTGVISLQRPFQTS
jgi:hypothetical protein